MAHKKLIISNRDDILGSVILALATRCAGKQIAAGCTKESLRENGFFVLRFSREDQATKLGRLVKGYVPMEMQHLIEIVNLHD